MGKCACSKAAKNQTSNKQPEPTTPDRYVSFKEIDCDGNARLLMGMIRRHIDDPARTNAFWEYFKKKAEGGSGPKPDDLFLMVHRVFPGKAALILRKKYSESRNP